ncbi:MAG: hypothetical protein ACREP2_07140 [Rhodanobacteraceae bacterium]
MAATKAFRHSGAIAGPIGDGTRNPFRRVAETEKWIDSRHPWRSPAAAFGVRSGILPPQSGSARKQRGRPRNDDKFIARSRVFETC